MYACFSRPAKHTERNRVQPPGPREERSQRLSCPMQVFSQAPAPAGLGPRPIFHLHCRPVHLESVNFCESLQRDSSCRPSETDCSGNEHEDNQMAPSIDLSHHLRMVGQQDAEPSSSHVRFGILRRSPLPAGLGHQRRNEREQTLGSQEIFRKCSIFYVITSPILAAKF